MALRLQLGPLIGAEVKEHVGPDWTILVADRNRHVRDFLRRELEAEGYAVVVARDGHEVWDILKGSDPPDLLILDLEIPYLEDLEKQALFQEQNPRVPLIIHSFAEDIPGRANLANATAFLEKNEDPARLKAVVAEVLNKFSPRAASDGQV